MIFTFWDYVLLGTFLIGLLYIYGLYKISFYGKKGVKTLPAYPFVGNTLRSLMRKEHFNDTVLRGYKEFSEEKYFGFYQFHKPNLIIKDVEIIKQITIKDFDHFQDHQTFVDEDIDPLFGKNLLSLKGKKWRDMRATLSPAFTSSKMRNVFTFVAECGENLVNYYSEKMKEAEHKEKGLIEIEMKDTFARYANDIIASTAFGIKVDSLNDKENEFYLMGKKATVFTTLQFIKMILLLFSPKLLKVLKISFFGEKLSKFFRNLVTSQIKYREANNIVRPDMLHLLMEAKKGSLKHEEANENRDTGFATVEESKLGKQSIKMDLCDDDIVAQAILFFLAGFDTTSTILSFLANELAINSDVQKKLQDEIDEFSLNNNGKPTYNDIQNMKYMDMVVSEILRKWPPGPLLDRKCMKSYTLPQSTIGSKPLKLNVNDGVMIPVMMIQNDPNYYKDPEKFDPERFSDENKGSIIPNTYLPFGLGPRNCIGSRFALMEVKSVIYYLLSKFDFIETSKTANPIVLSTKVFNMVPEGGFWIGLKPRQKL